MEKAPVGERKFLDIDMDNFDKRMAAIEPGVRFRVDNKLGSQGGSSEKLGVELKFEKMDDFGPAAIARQVPALAKLLQAREQLANLQRYMDGKIAAEDRLKELLQDPDLMRLLADRRTIELSKPSIEESDIATSKE